MRGQRHHCPCFPLPNRTSLCKEQRNATSKECRGHVYEQVKPGGLRTRPDLLTPVNDASPQREDERNHTGSTKLQDLRVWAFRLHQVLLVVVLASALANTFII